MNVQEWQLLKIILYCAVSNAHLWQSVEEPMFSLNLLIQSFLGAFVIV